MDVIERARAYMGKYCPPGISGENRHAATFYAASVLVNGFALGENDAWRLLSEFNATCKPPSDEKKLQYRLKRALASASVAGKGYLLKSGHFIPSSRERMVRKLAGGSQSSVSPYVVPEKAEFDPAALAKIAKPWRSVDLLWLADRSSEDPAQVSRTRFLELLYRPGEKVKIFTSQASQGQALWPCPEEDVPDAGKFGVLYLAAPVDGKEYVNPRVPPDKDGRAKVSTRSEESVTSWRWMVVESDSADVRDWLGCIVQMPLRIAALYTSGGRSVHALIRIDTRTKSEWDEAKAAVKPWLVILGADPGALSAVRLTRLPGCWREGKMVTSKATKEQSYKSLATDKSPRGAMQKLLYINPDPQVRAICDLARLRDVESAWLKRADGGISDADEMAGEWLLSGLDYYATVSSKCRDVAAKLREGMVG